MNKFFALIWIFIAASCATYQDIRPSEPLTPGTQADCAASCVNLRKLGCPDGNPTPAGAACEAVCINTETSGYASENPQCLAKITACDQEDACANP